MKFKFPEVMKWHRGFLASLPVIAIFLAFQNFSFTDIAANDVENPYGLPVEPSKFLPHSKYPSVVGTRSFITPDGRSNVVGSDPNGGVSFASEAYYVPSFTYMSNSNGEFIVKKYSTSYGYLGRVQFSKTDKVNPSMALTSSNIKKRRYEIVTTLDQKVFKIVGKQCQNTVASQAAYDQHEACLKEVESTTLLEENVNPLSLSHYRNDDGDVVYWINNAGELKRLSLWEGSSSPPTTLGVIPKDIENPTVVFTGGAGNTKPLVCGINKARDLRCIGTKSLECTSTYSSGTWSFNCARAIYSTASYVFATNVVAVFPIDLKSVSNPRVYTADGSVYSLGRQNSSGGGSSWTTNVTIEKTFISKTPNVEAHYSGSPSLTKSLVDLIYQAGLLRIATAEESTYWSNSILSGHKTYGQLQRAIFDDSFSNPSTSKAVLNDLYLRAYGRLPRETEMYVPTSYPVHYTYGVNGVALELLKGIKASGEYKLPPLPGSSLNENDGLNKIVTRSYQCALAREPSSAELTNLKSQMVQMADRCFWGAHSCFSHPPVVFESILKSLNANALVTTSSSWAEVWQNRDDKSEGCWFINPTILSTINAYLLEN